VKEVILPTASHQTIKLSKGKHTAPEHGACVIELASMLAGERFTDHPPSVSRTIGAFLRGYNDLVDRQRRQDLFRYAALCVGTAGEETVEDARVSRLLGWAERRGSHAGFRMWFARMRQPRSRASNVGPEGAANYALRTMVRTGASHRDVLTLVDELIALGEPAGGVPASLETEELPSGGGPERLELAALG
jgi:hypothetical protein